MKCDPTTKRYSITVPADNSFRLILPLKTRTYVSNVSIDAPIVYTELEDVVLTIGGTEYDVTLGLQGVEVYVPDGLAKGVYDIILTATYHGALIRAAYFEAMHAVEWQYLSDFQQYLVGSPIVADAAIVIGGPLTDEQLEELKEQYIAAKQAADEARAEAEAEKQEYAEKIEELDDIAKQGKDQNASLTNNYWELTSAISMYSWLLNGHVFIAEMGEDRFLWLLDTYKLVVIDSVEYRVLVGNEYVESRGIGTMPNLYLFKNPIEGEERDLNAYVFDVENMTRGAVVGRFAMDDQFSLISYIDETLDEAGLAKQGSDSTATLTALKALINALPTVQQIQNGLAKTSELPTDYALEATEKNIQAEQFGIATLFRLLHSGYYSIIKFQSGGGGGGPVPVPTVVSTGIVTGQSVTIDNTKYAIVAACITSQLTNVPDFYFGITDPNLTVGSTVYRYTPSTGEKGNSVGTITEHNEFMLASEQNATANKNAIIEAVNNAQPDLSSVAKQTDLLVVKSDAAAAKESAHNIAQFFNLPQALPSGYHAMTEAEVLEIADEVWDAMYGFVAVPNTVHTVNARGQQVEFETYMNPTKTYADYGWPALWDAQGVTIPLTDHPTANRVIYTFNPSND